MSSHPKLLAMILTAQDLIDVESRVLLREEFPGTDHTIGRIDQGAVHVEEAAIANRSAVPVTHIVEGTYMASN